MLEQERQARVQELDGERMSDITFVSTKDLIEELFSRYEHAVFAGIKIVDAESILSKRDYKGNSDTCIGLCAKIQHLIIQDWEKADRMDEAEAKDVG